MRQNNGRNGRRDGEGLTARCRQLLRHLVDGLVISRFDAEEKTAFLTYGSYRAPGVQHCRVSLGLLAKMERAGLVYAGRPHVGPASMLIYRITDAGRNQVV